MFPTFLLRTPKFCDFCAAALGASTFHYMRLCAYFSDRARSPITCQARCFFLPHQDLRRTDRCCGGKPCEPGKCSTNHRKPLAGFRMRPIPRSMRAARILCAYAHSMRIIGLLAHQCHSLAQGTALLAVLALGAGA